MFVVDVWTMSSYRRQGIASAMMRELLTHVPGQHVGLQTDDGQALYESLGFEQVGSFAAARDGRPFDVLVRHES